MQTVSYESLRAEQAWMIVSDQLQHRNNLLAKGISHMERHVSELPMASRLMMLRYHLKMSLRQLTSEARQQVRTTPDANRLRQQWLHVHQLFFLLRQIDTELNRATLENDNLRSWVEATEARVYRSALVHLN
ncbi:hypothetical protein [Spirosoma montaniterrae]|uniref:Uncharacterized protein n=1 Tax=Spirosoma montaniterrae TaxID=1178516 RepID=A0A1P9WWJ0_9BACT|nr:hypothetical protein [Spirosoma montaniterrae]AQG79700.1 hypothetical protein AWR27_10395 [Spirosoma montaniterrae]